MTQNIFLMENELIIYPVKVGHHPLIYFLLVLTCLLSVFIFSFYQEQSMRLLSASVSSKSKSLLNRIDSETIKKVGRYMNLFFFINVLLFIYGFLYHYNLFGEMSKIQIIYLFVGVLFLYLAKFLLHYFMGFLFKNQDLIKNYLEELYLKYKLFGVILFPLLLILLFSKQFGEIALFIGISTYVLCWIMVSFFSLKVGLKSKSFPKYYPFVYICALEILPWALIGKIFHRPLAALFGL
jgi:hypothetical protein